MSAVSKRQFGMHVPRRGHLATAESVTAVAQAAEEYGFTSLWSGEHIVMPVTFDSRYPHSDKGTITWEPATPWLDPIISLTWAAAVTSSIRLGTSIMILPQREPLSVAKLIATLDHMSGGRVLLGVGAGWLAEEFELLGADFADRGARLDEAIRTLKTCWSDEVILLPPPAAQIPFTMEPKPAQRGRLPILCGGKTAATLRRVAALGDGWLPSHVSPADLRRDVPQLVELLAQRGRARDEVTIAPLPNREPPMSTDLAQEYFDAGADIVICDADFSGTLENALRSIRDLAEGLKL